MVTILKEEGAASFQGVGGGANAPSLPPQKETLAMIFDLEKILLNHYQTFVNVVPELLLVWVCIISCQNLPFMPNSLHEDPTFSIHSLAHTVSSCLLCCHDYIATCASARVLNVCAFITSCLRSYHIQRPHYYCAFI